MDSIIALFFCFVLFLIYFSGSENLFGKKLVKPFCKFVLLVCSLIFILEVFCFGEFSDSKLVW